MSATAPSLAAMTNTQLPHPPLVIPRGWSVVHRPVPEVAVLISAPRVPDSGYRPRATLTSARCALTLPELMEEQATALVHTLTLPEMEDHCIEDLCDCDVGYLRVLHQVGPSEVITDAWTWLVDDIAWTLACSVGLSDYPIYCDVFDDLATSFDPAA